MLTAPLGIRIRSFLNVDSGLSVGDAIRDRPFIEALRWMARMGTPGTRCRWRTGKGTRPIAGPPGETGVSGRAGGETGRIGSPCYGTAGGTRRVSGRAPHQEADPALGRNRSGAPPDPPP